MTSASGPAGSPSEFSALSRTNTGRRKGFNVRNRGRGCQGTNRDCLHLVVTKPRVIHLHFLPLPRAFFLPTSQASLAPVGTILMTIPGAGSCQGKHGTELRDHADTCHSCAGLLARHGSSFPRLFLLLCAIGQKDLSQAVFAKLACEDSEGPDLFPSKLDPGLSVEDRGCLILTTGS